MQTNLGESEKRFKALKETVQHKAPALPFLASQDSSTQVRKLFQTPGKAIGKGCMPCSIALDLAWSLAEYSVAALGSCPQSFAMPCYAMLCYAVLCYAVLRCAMLCYAMGDAQPLLKRRLQSC